MGRDEPGGADADRAGEKGDAGEQERRLPQGGRQDVRDEVRPHLRVALGCGQQQGRERREHDERRRSEQRQCPQRRAGGAPPERREDQPAMSECGLQLSNPTLSTSWLAALRCFATPSSGSVSGLSGPNDAMISSGWMPAFTGYSKFTSA